MKKIILTLLMAFFSVSSGNEICKHLCEGNFLCVDDWSIKDTSEHNYCEANIKEQRQKCIKECQMRQKRQLR